MQRLTSSKTMHRSGKWLLAGLVGLGLAGAAPAQEPQQEQNAEQAETGNPNRIRLVNVNGYSVIDREHLVLNGGASRHYLVTLQRSCFGLRSGVQIGTSFPATTTLYTPFMEYITVENGPLDERCYIDTIEAVESVDAARLLIEQRAQAEAEDTPSLR